MNLSNLLYGGCNDLFHSCVLRYCCFSFYVFFVNSLQDKLIADFIPRVIPNVQVGLTSTKQRLAILPGGTQSMESARMISDIQETIRRKVGNLGLSNQ
jgi:hypothetical protein